MHQKSDSLNFDRESQNNKSFQAKSLSISPLNLNTLATNATNYIDTGLDTSSQKQYKGQNSGINYESLYTKLAMSVKDMFVDMRNKLARDDPNCALLIKKSVPFDQDEESVGGTDAMVFLQYIRKIYEKIYEFKNEAEMELSSKKENECSDYEGMLQKLEAEVRQHIRIEQQLKLYVESTQAKLDDLEKTYDPIKNESIKKDNEELKNTAYTLSEKVKKRENEIESYKKDLHNKGNMIKELEQQTENIPILKNKIRELERVIANGGARPPSANILKGSNKSNRDYESVDKNQSFSHPSTGENKTRKASQPALLQAYDLSKQRHHDKENLETFKIDLSKPYDNSKGYRSSSQSEANKNVDNTKSTENINRSGASKKDDGDFNSVLERMKKSLRSHSGRNVSKEDLRGPDQTINPEELLENNAKSFDLKMSKRESEPSSSKYDYDKKMMKSGNSFHEYDRKTWEKQEHKKDSKPPHNKSAYYKDASELEHNNPRSSIPRPRPSSGHHESSVNQSYVDYTKYKKESEAYDLNKLKAPSPKKNLQQQQQERSQSVDPKQRLYKSLKSNSDIVNKPNPNVGDENNTSFTGGEPQKFTISSNNVYRNPQSVLKNSYI
jgi:hypothetical protein